MSNIDNIAKDFMNALTSSKRATSPYDSRATVLRTEGDTAWVHIPGGIDETPVRMTVNAVPGDEVQVRVSGGRAWIVGNATAPPTDDRTAHTAITLAGDVQTNLENFENSVMTDSRVANSIVENSTVVNSAVTNAIIDQSTVVKSEIYNSSIENFTVIDGVVQDLQATDAEIQGTLTAHEGIFDSLDTNYAHITNGVIDNATIGYADVDNLDAHYANIDLANVNNAWIQNGVVKDAAISDAQIIGVSANKLTAGTIDASNITVTNLNANNITTGTINGQRIGTGSLSLDKLSDAVYTEAEVDSMLDTMQQEIDGAIETYTGSVVPTLNNYPASGWSVNDRSKHVGDVYYVVNAGNQADGYCYRFAYDNSTGTYGWVLIKDSDVTAALQRLIDAEGDIDDLEDFQSQTSSWISNTDEALTSIKSNVTSLTTRMSTAEGNITNKVDTSTFSTLSQTVGQNSATITTLTETVATKADASDIPTNVSDLTNDTGFITDADVPTKVSDLQNDSGFQTSSDVAEAISGKADSSTVTTLSNTVNNVSQTATSNSSKITQLTQTLGTNADGTTKANDVMHKISDVTQDLDGFKTTVSQTYYLASNPNGYTGDAAANAVAQDLANNYSTTSQMTSAINQSAANITTTVSQTYATKTSVYTKTETDGLLDDKADSSDLTALTGRVTTAESNISQNADNIALKVNATDVYSKTVADALLEVKANKATLTSEINASADTVKINADRVNIEGATIFSSGRLSETSLDNAYDAKGAASTAEANAKAAIPTDVSDLNNDSGFITSADVPTKVSELQNDSGYQNSTQVNSAITSKGYQTASQVSSAVSSGISNASVSDLSDGSNYSTTAQMNSAISTATSDMATNTSVANTYATKANAVKRTQRIYYQNNSTTAPSTPGTASSNWVTDNTGDSGKWTKKRMSYSSDNKYIWTCEQSEKVSGTVSYTTVLLDDSTTVIDGGNIITGTVTANKLNASDINASNSLTIGAMATDTQSQILNSNIQVGGRNLLQDTNLNSLTKVAGPANRYFSDSGQTAVTPTINRTIANPPVSGIEYGAQFVLSGSTDGATGRCLAFYSTSNGQTGTTPTLIKGRYYTMSCWAVCTTGTADIRFQIGRGNVASPYTGLYYNNKIGNSTYCPKMTDIAIPHYTNASSWKHFEWTFLYDEQWGSGGYPIWYFGVWGQAADATVVLCGFKLEEGNKSTSWTPAPEDVDADISDAAKTATNYISIDGAGIKVHSASDETDYLAINSNSIGIYRDNVNVTSMTDAAVRIGQEASGKYNTLIDGNGMQIRKNTTVLAEYGDTITLGQLEDNYRLTLSSKTLDFNYGDSNNSIFKVEVDSTRHWDKASIILPYGRISSSQSEYYMFLGTPGTYLTLTDGSGTTGIRFSNHTSDIGSIHGVYLSTAKAVANTTWVAVISLSIPAGTWVVTYGARFPSNATGYRNMNLYTASAQAKTDVDAVAVSGNVTQLRCSKVLNITENTTYYLNVYQNSGSSLTLPATAEGEGTFIQAVRIL